MVTWRKKHVTWPTAALLMLVLAPAWAQQAGSIRGVIYDKDFEAPVPGARVVIAETGEEATSADEGNYVFSQVTPGSYTLVFSKEGYTRQIKSDVVVRAGSMTEVDVWLTGDFTEMEEFVVQDLQFGAGTEAALLELRMDSPALLDSIGAELMSQAGAGDAAAALRLVAGASVQDGKYAVIRGLPDRYVNSQLSGLRLPTADADKRAVQLDQFPSDVIESIQVSKTFTPDQQGDASGGAVNVVLKGIPDEPVLKFSLGAAYNTQFSGKNDFLTYEDGSVDYWGRPSRPIPVDRLGQNWPGAVGVSRDDAPFMYDWSIAGGGRHEFDNGVRIGGFGTVFYEQDTAGYDDGIDDKYWVTTPGGPMTPQYSQGAPGPGGGDFKTSLFDTQKGEEEVKWGTLGVLGAETEKHALDFLYMYTRAVDDEATLAEDTRGKRFYYPDYDPYDPLSPGNQEREAAPYLRTETLQYTVRTTETFRLGGRHTLFEPEFRLGSLLTPLAPELDWTLARSSSELKQPDKRQFGSQWWGPHYNPGFPPWVPPFTDPAVHLPFKPAVNFTLGNEQRIWKEIAEESSQFFANVKLPFKNWTDNEGYLKFGLFYDDVDRQYNQDSFSNFGDNSARYEAPWEEHWSERFPREHHPITAGEIDVDYDGKQKITAYYGMIDVPLLPQLNLIGGARFEKTELGIVNYPEKDVNWIPPNSSGQVKLNPGDADVDYTQEDILPSIGLVYTPWEKLTARLSYTQTTARQTFKELTPIQQQEFLGGDVFVGNPQLTMSALKNYDLRLDYTPFEEGLLSLSYFYKDVKDPIEYVQRIAEYSYTTPVNYPDGTLSGVEFEARQGMGRLWDGLAGLSLGVNATFISSEVTLPESEARLFEQPNIRAPMPTRDMTNAPERLFNWFATYELDALGWKGAQAAVFYSVRGDTLIAGAGQSGGHFVPSVYETEYGTLNLSLSQKVGEHFSAKFQVKNLTDPEIQTVYRSAYIDEDVVKTSYRKGVEFSLGISVKF